MSKIQQYSDNFVQDLLRAGLTSAMHAKPLEVPQFGQISGIVLLGSKSVRSSVFCLWSSVHCPQMSPQRIHCCFCLMQEPVGNPFIASEAI